MTRERYKLHIVDSKQAPKLAKSNFNKTIHKTQTMALLKKLLDEKGSSQLELANTLGRDKTTVNRWVKNSREISWDNAEKIASVLGCHPVDIYQPKNQIKLKFYVKWDGDVLEFEKEDQHLISIPYEYYHENVKAVQMQAPGFHADGEIWLFDMPVTKKFSKHAIGKLCYLTASKIFKKKHENKSKKCKPVIALLRRSEEHTSELQSQSTISYAVFCLKKKKKTDKKKKKQKERQEIHKTKTQPSVNDYKHTITNHKCRRIR